VLHSEARTVPIAVERLDELLERQIERLFESRLDQVSRARTQV